MRERIRTVRLAPYRKGMGPRFTLHLYDTGRVTGGGRTQLGYALLEGRETIFAGDDFGPSPIHADDSDESVRALLSFLTLRPGDTDADYFADYTERQRQFTEEHAEALSWEATCRFGED